MNGYEVGDRITCPQGLEWVIHRAWQFQNWWCVHMFCPDTPDDQGGTRFRMSDDGGLTVVTR